MPIPSPQTFRRGALAGALALAVLAAACSGEKPPAAGATPATPSALPQSASAAPLLSPAPLLPLPEDVAGRELETYHLSLARVKVLGKAQHALTVLGKQHPEVVNSMRMVGQPKTFDEFIARLDAQPDFKRALADAGTNPHDYILAMVVLSKSMQGYRQKMSGLLPATGVPPIVLDNIDFVAKNLPAIQKAMAGRP